jgi:hypothetical protein
MSDPESLSPSGSVSVRTPYGYAWCKGKLVPDPVEAPVRKLMYELLVQLRRKKAVARALNEAGIRTRDGGEWSDTTIDRLIRDPTPVGWYRSNPTTTVEVQPIISQELWKECNEFLDSNDLGRRRGRQAIHLFAGFVLCHCGRRMYVRTHSHDYRCTACDNRIAADKLEAIFVEQIKGYPPLLTGDGPYDLHACWPSLKETEKRHVVQGLVERIVVGEDDIDITLCSPPEAVPTQAETQPAGPLLAAQASQAPAGGPVPTAPKVDPVALAIALMKDHPEWSARKLAEAVGCSHTTLTRSALFRTAKALAGDKRSLPKGWRLPDGRIEARGDDSDST